MQTSIDYINNELKPFYPDAEIKSFTRLILEHVCQIKPYEISIHKDRKISANERTEIEQIVAPLKEYKPIQYILGTTEFFGLIFSVNQSVLIPRPETEELVELVLKNHLEKGSKNLTDLKILDIGTGSGCIAVSLAKNIPSAAIYAIDISEDALSTAKENAIRNQVEIQFFQQDILSDSLIAREIARSNLLQNDILDCFSSSAMTERSFDVIVSNPPYITPAEKSSMHDNVLNYEPHAALFVPQDNPLLFYERIADIGHSLLNKSGFLYFEINALYGNETCQMLQAKGYSNIKLYQDIFRKAAVTWIKDLFATAGCTAKIAPLGRR